MTAQPSQPISVLCVDDNDLVCEAMHRRLRLPEFEFTGYLLTAERLLEEVESRGADLVVLDIDMPGSDTIAALRSVKANRPRTRVAALSGVLDEAVIERVIDAGVDGYIAKSEDSRTIVDSLKRVAGGEFVMSRDVRMVYPAPDA